MIAVGYSSPFVPAEWIAAHGFRPKRLRLHATEMLTRGICPYAGALLNGAPWSDVSALVLTTVCDQMRYVAVALNERGGCPVFLLNVPSMWETPAARQLYRDELRRLGRFLEQLGGQAPTDADLTKVMLDHARSRDNSSQRPTAGGESAGIPLAILGGPTLKSDSGFFDLVEHAGGRVVVDGTEEGERALPRAFDPERVAVEPFEELADAYFDGIPDVFRRPNTRFYEWLSREIAARQVRGIIVRRYLWCDLWHAEVWRLKEWSSTPVLEVDVGPDDISAPNRVQGRIEAFLETLK